MRRDQLEFPTRGDRMTTEFDQLLSALRMHSRVPGVTAYLRAVVVHDVTKSDALSLAYAEVNVARDGDCVLGPSLDYGRVRTRSEALAVSELISRLESAASRASFRCGELEVVRHDLDQRWWVNSHYSSSRRCPWPCVEGSSSEIQLVLPIEPLFAPNAPYFDGTRELIESFATTPSYEQTRSDRRMTIVIWDYRAGFELPFEVQASSLVCSVRGDDLSRIRIRGRTRSTQIDQIDMPAEARNVIPLDPDAADISLVLVDADGETLDYKRLSLLAAGSMVRSSEEDYARELLLGGETATVEFKCWIDPTGNKIHEVLETVIAMANGRGGTVIVGVDNHGTPEWDGRVHKWMRSKRDSSDVETAHLPSNERAVTRYGRRLRDEVQQFINHAVTMQVGVVLIDGIHVLLLLVEPGDERPYQDRRNCLTWVRTNATNRHPNAEETRALGQPRR